MKSYCTNCGMESSKKVCESCGVKKYFTHNYCAYCGTALNENAAICTNCKESVKQEPFFWNIVNLLASLPPLLFLLIAVTNAQPIQMILCTLFSFLLCMPFIKSIIRRTTIGKKVLRSVLKIVRIIAIVAFFMIGVGSYTVPEVEVEITVYANEATAAAEVVFHEEVRLKNEASYVLNDSDVRWQTTPYNDVEGSPWRYVVVVLDYSAENGFGGTNREFYTVEMLFNMETGTYHRIDGKSQIFYSLSH